MLYVMECSPGVPPSYCLMCGTIQILLLDYIRLEYTDCVGLYYHTFFVHMQRIQ